MDKHTHAAALKRIGHGTIQSHFNITRQALWKWTKKGVPAIHHNSIRDLAARRGVQVPEFNVGESK